MTQEFELADLKMAAFVYEEEPHMAIEPRPLTAERRAELATVAERWQRSDDIRERSWSVAVTDILAALLHAEGELDNSRSVNHSFVREIQMPKRLWLHERRSLLSRIEALGAELTAAQERVAELEAENERLRRGLGHVCICPYDCPAPVRFAPITTTSGCCTEELSHAKRWTLRNTEVEG